MLTTTHRFLTAALLAASASFPASATTPIACPGSGSAGAFTITCAVLEDTTSKFHMRITGIGVVRDDVATFRFSYSGNWLEDSTTIFYPTSYIVEGFAFEIGWGWHVVPPHGEGIGPFFDSDLNPVQLGGVAAIASAELAHGMHFDRWTASHFYDAKGRYQLNIFASHTPEPATWAMMVLGFGAVGAAVRRRRSGRVAA